MSSPIGFFTPVTRGSQSSFLLKAVDVFDDYFYFGGKKWEVIKVTPSNHCYLQQKVYKRSLGVSILIAISILTVAVPLIMLIGKAIARSKCHFQLAVTKAVKIQSAVRGYVARKKFQKELEEIKNIQSAVRAFQTRKRLKHAVRDIVARKKIEKSLAATKIQSAVRGLVARKKFQKELAVIKIQSHVRTQNARNEFLKLKRAATLIQSLHRANKTRKEFLELKEAALKIQAHYRTQKERKEFLKLRKVAIVTQSHVRRIQAHEELQKLKQAENDLTKRCGKKKKRILVSLIEFVLNEKTHLQKMKDELAKIQTDEFQKFLKKNPESKKVFLEFYDRVEAHIQYCRSNLIRPLENLTEFLPNISEEEFNKFVCPKPKETSDWHEKLETRRFAYCKRDVTKLCEFVRTDSFIEYLKAKVELGLFNEKYLELFENQNIPNPCILASQRVMRYVLPLKEMKENAIEIWPQEPLVLESLDHIITTINNVTDKYNNVMKIREINRLVQKSRSLEQPLGWWEWIRGSRTEMKDSHEKELENLMNGTLEHKPKAALDSESDEAKMQSLLGELVENQINIFVKRVQELLESAKKRQDFINKESPDHDELKGWCSKLENAILWMKSGEKIETLEKLITKIKVEMHLFEIQSLAKTEKAKQPVENQAQLKKIVQDFT